MLSKLLIDKTKPQTKSVRLSDGRGMYLEISPAGGKWWRFKYRFAGKERRISLGVYPDVSLAAAREKREEARRQVAAGIDPGEQRKAAKVALVESTENTFEAIAREWFGLFSTRWVKGHADKIIRRLELNVFPWLGSRPIKAITAPELLAVLRRIESRGANETAHRALQVCGRVFRYAIATGRAERDPSRDLSGALAPIQERHFASITEPLAVGQLLRAIDAYKGAFVTRCALRLAPLVFVRPGELRAAQWAEFDFDKSAAHRPVSLRLPERSQSLPCHERECSHRRASPYGLHRRGHDRPRIPKYGLDVAQRAGLESRCHRAAAGARGTRRRAGGLQLRRASARAAAHDAGLGGLFGETQEWIRRRSAFSKSRRLGAEHLSNRWGTTCRDFAVPAPFWAR
jgi:integrase